MRLLWGRGMALLDLATLYSVKQPSEAPQGPCRMGSDFLEGAEC